MATALKLRSDINKLKKALQTKGISDSVKSKLKNQLERAESELNTIKKTGKAPKRSSVKSTKTALTALQKLVNRKKYSVYKGAGVDLEKDAGQGALATGRRESKGLKANQHGDKGSNKGNVYYEYRPNHLDVKQPKKKQTYPKLAEGGEMSSKNYKVQYNVGKSKYVINYHDGEKKHKDGSPFYDVAIFKNMKDFMAYKKKLNSEGYKEMAKGGYMAGGGEVGQGFLIRDMREKLNKMFPDTFGFTVGNISKEGNEVQNSSALVVDRRDPYRGLEDKDIQSKLFFPQYKRDHDIRFRIYQGGENTYFYFLLESENGDQYIGQFGFKDQGDVSSDYITRFIAFLMEQYGLPFQVNHSVMEKGGYMASGGKVKVGDTLTASTGVKVKVVEYDPMFGGRVKIERMDEYATGKPSQWMPLSKFKMADGGMMADGAIISKTHKLG